MATSEEKAAAAQDVFVRASPDSEWFTHMRGDGSCLRLYDLLEENRKLIHELGPWGQTVLHKGVTHGCVKLVRFILVGLFDGNGHCTCGLDGAESHQCPLTREGLFPKTDKDGSTAVKSHQCPLTREGLLRKTDKDGSIAVNLAVVSGSPKMVLLLEWAIDVSEHFKTMRERDIVRSQSGTAQMPVEPAPDMTDGTIHEEMYGGSHNVVSKVYELIEEKILRKDWGDDQGLMDELKNDMKEHADYNFVPVAHVLLHFLIQTQGWTVNPLVEGSERMGEFRKKILKEIIVACHECDQNLEGTSEKNSVDRGPRNSVLMAMFQILDPRGRNILHVWLRDSRYPTLGVLADILEDMGKRMNGREQEKFWKITSECVNATDAAGRTLLHLACIYDERIHPFIMERLDWHAYMFPRCCGKLEALKKWCSFEIPSGVVCKPVHLGVLFNSQKILSTLLNSVKERNNVLSVEEANKILNTSLLSVSNLMAPLQIATFLGRTTIVENILKHHSVTKSIIDKGFGSEDLMGRLPAIHYAAISGQVATIQTILKHPLYDPICQHHVAGTALHLLLDIELFERSTWETYVQMMEGFKCEVLSHVLPSSYKLRECGFSSKDDHPQCPRMFSANEETCINLLLQAGIDIWTPHCESGEAPNPGPNTNNEARKWWYQKVVNEVVTQKASITSAANATSVIGALVATTSFIGPLQPPLSYSGDGGFIDTTRSSVQVYLVGNSLSFFFSIASILMALLPAIPMPKESMYDELVRSQRSLKAAALLLLISINCTLISFSSASIAVVSSEWQKKQAVVVFLGGVICAAVLVVYIIRLLRMVFHKNDRFRRLFARYMYF